MGRGIAVLAVAGVLVMAGCTGSGGGTPSTMSSTSAPATTSLTPTPSTTSTTTDSMTPLQREAIAAVEGFYAAFDAGAKSRSSMAFRKAYVRACAPCESLAARIDTLADKGLTLQGGDSSTTGLSALQGTDKGIGVQGELITSAAKLKDSSGRVSQSFTEERLKNVLWLLRREGALLKVVEIRA